MTLKDKAIDAFKSVIESREPVHERIIGQLGNAAGVVEVPSRPNFNYVRLSGATTRTVRAYNLAVAPELDRYVWVEISRVEGEPKYYRVVGYSEYESEGSPTDPPVYPGGQSAAEKVVVWTAGSFFTNEKMHNVLSGDELHKNIGSNIEVKEIGTATYDDVQDWLNSTQSSGKISGGAITSHLDAITGVTQGGAGAGEFKISGDHTAIYTAVFKLTVTGSTGNDAHYTVSAGGSTHAGGTTTIPVDEAVPSAVADGSIYNGRADVAAGTGFIKISDSSIAVTKFFDWAASNNLALTIVSTNYIHVNYNAGSPIVEATDDRTTISLNTEFTLGRIYRGDDGRTYPMQAGGLFLSNYLRNEHERLILVHGFERASGGTISEYGTRNIASTEGVFYLGLNQVPTTVKQSTVDYFTSVYYDGANWIWTEGQTQVDNQQYNNIAAGLVNLSNNKYGVYWVCIDYSSNLFVVYGRGDYTLTEARNAAVPAFMPVVATDFGIVAAKVIVEEDGVAFEEIICAYTTRIPSACPAIHNDLGGLQGGTADEYYHLTATEHGYISGANSQSLLTTASPTFADITITADGVITFGAQVGDKLLLYAGGGYGLGVEAGVLQIITHASNTDIVFGHGTSVAFTEILRIHGEGNITVKNGMWLGTHGAERIVFDATNHYISFMDCDVGVGIAAPEALLHVYGGDSGGTPSAAADMIIEDNGATLLQFLSPSSSYNDIYFGDADSFQAGWLRYYHAAVNADDLMNFRVNEDIRVTILGSGNVGFGVTDPDTLLELYKVGTQLKLSGGAVDYATFAVAADGALTITTVDDTAALGHICFMPDGNVGINEGAPGSKLDVNGDIDFTNAVYTSVSIDLAGIAINTWYSLDEVNWHGLGGSYLIDLYFLTEDQDTGFLIQSGFYAYIAAVSSDGNVFVTSNEFAGVSTIHVGTVPTITYRFYKTAASTNRLQIKLSNVDGLAAHGATLYYRRVH